MKIELLYDSEGVKCYAFARDPDKSEQVIDTNEYLLISGDTMVMLDPGGTEIFPSVVTAVSQVIDVTKIKTFVCSHQDPDIMSSLPLWMGLCPEAHIYLPWLWAGFVAHFGHEYASRFVPVPDEGCEIALGSRRLNIRLVPAHYCHSSGNFSVYDPQSRILFSGDIGAALLPPDHNDLFVTDFTRHIPYMKMFHQRWMPSNAAKNAWIERVRVLDIAMICPQHGAIMKGEDVGKFLDWFQALEVGSAIPPQ